MVVERQTRKTEIEMLPIIVCYQFGNNHQWIEEPDKSGKYCPICTAKIYYLSCKEGKHLSKCHETYCECKCHELMIYKMLYIENSHMWTLNDIGKSLEILSRELNVRHGNRRKEK